jgi:hypothetical protein
MYANPFAEGGQQLGTSPEKAGQQLRGASQVGGPPAALRLTESKRAGIMAWARTGAEEGIKPAPSALSDANTVGATASDPASARTSEDGSPRPQRAQAYFISPDGKGAAAAELARTQGSQGSNDFVIGAAGQQQLLASQRMMGAADKKAGPGPQTPKAAPRPSSGSEARGRAGQPPGGMRTQSLAARLGGRALADLMGSPSSGGGGGLQSRLTTHTSVATSQYAPDGGVGLDEDGLTEPSLSQNPYYASEAVADNPVANYVEVRRSWRWCF